MYTSKLKTASISLKGLFFMSLIHIHTRPTRVDWLKGLYRAGLLSANHEDCLLADKLYFGQLIEKHLGDEAYQFYPKTRGLKSFSKKLLSLDPIALKTELSQEFPSGWIVKPNAEINSGGESLGFYFNNDKFLNDFKFAVSDLGSAEAATFKKANIQLIQSALFEDNWISKDLDQFTTGERLIIQTDLGSELAGIQSSKSREWQEVRVHTYGSDVIPNASYHRWAVNPIKSKLFFKWAESHVQTLLNKLPQEYLKGRAWSLDVVVFDKDKAKILDVNTNRGRQGHWSGFLDRPRLLKAYTVYFQKNSYCRFDGFSGFLFRMGIANTHKYLKRRYIERIN